MAFPKNVVQYFSEELCSNYQQVKLLAFRKRVIHVLLSFNKTHHELQYRPFANPQIISTRLHLQETETIRLSTTENDTFSSDGSAPLFNIPYQMKNIHWFRTCLPTTHVIVLVRQPTLLFITSQFVKIVRIEMKWIELCARLQTKRHTMCWPNAGTAAAHTLTGPLHASIYLLYSLLDAMIFS